MEKILFHTVVPDVFSSRNDLTSDIWNQDICLQKGYTYLVEADSGKGKSTLCSYILGYRHDYMGTIEFDGKDIRSFGMREWTENRRIRVSCLFQELRLFPELTAFENVEIKNRITQFKKRRQIIEWFERVGLSDKIDTRIAKMSYGQQQRVAMLRALTQPFDFILVDEPVSHLDENNSIVLSDVMEEEVRRQGAAVIVTSIGKRMPLTYDRVFRL